jgi:hypothetical protein
VFCEIEVISEEGSKIKGGERWKGFIFYWQKCGGKGDKNVAVFFKCRRILKVV